MEALKIVLLVVIITVAILVMVFVLPNILIASEVSELVSSQTELLDEKASKSIMCSYGNINMKQLVFQTATNELSGILQNTGQISLGKISLNITYQGGSSELIGLCEGSSDATVCSSSDLSLKTEEEKTFNVETGRNDLNSVKVTTNCSVATDTSELENIIIS